MALEGRITFKGRRDAGPEEELGTSSPDVGCDIEVAGVVVGKGASSILSTGAIISTDGGDEAEKLAPFVLSNAISSSR